MDLGKYDFVRMNIHSFLSCLQLFGSNCLVSQVFVTDIAANVQLCMVYLILCCVVT